MEIFKIYNPVNVHFGKDVLDDFEQTVAQYGKTALLIYGGTSTTKYGYVDLIKNKLINHNIEVFEYNGVKPNPTVEQVVEAQQIAIEKSVECIVALGGGSVIDAAKIVSICVPEKLDPWLVMTRKQKAIRALPIISVLTLAATGSEMNCSAVIQSQNAGKKIGLTDPLIFPKHSFLNPEFTTTVSVEQTAYGVVDTIAHAIEAWFGTGMPTLTKRFVSSIITEAMYYGPLAISDPKNYDYRFNLMLAATCALNGITEICCSYGDWGVHSIGHELSLQFDIAHGASLSIVLPAWLKHHAKHLDKKISQLGTYLFNQPDTVKTIELLEKFFSSIGSPTSLPWRNITTEHKQQIINGLNKNRAGGYVHKLTDDDRASIVSLMFK
ncbi:MAG TPA: iron-containing alcohol dehydrogenase [Salinivirgaceae bacterium]|nr:iron-containing alcohol dehydrogenase [Salinivirgaceae bacterium]